MVRPELRAALRPWRETAAAGAVTAAGLWLMGMGGWLLVPLGAAVVGLGVGWGTLALRRMRFGQGVRAPGVVEVDEAQVGYLSADGGGFVSLAELTELRLTPLAGRRFWRLKQADGQALLIPVEAEGADRLFDAFAALPGMDSQALVAALAAPGPGPGEGAAPGPGPVVWRRAAPRLPHARP